MRVRERERREGEKERGEGRERDYQQKMHKYGQTNATCREGEKGWISAARGKPIKRLGLL